jgi:hypothetical protein
VAVYHADDIYDPAIVECEVDFLQRYPDAGAVFCLDTFIDAHGVEYGRLQIPPELRTERPLAYAVVLNALLTYKNRFLVGPTSMVRASVYRAVGPYRDEEFSIASDLEMWARISSQYPIGIILKHLHRYRHGHGNVTQNYFHLRTETEMYFTILDAHLADGGRALVTSRALAAHEAHRSEDRLMLAINQYIRGDLPQSRHHLQQVRLRGLLGSDKIERWRLLLLLFAMRLLTHLPRITHVADIFYLRWHRPRKT